MDRLTEKHVELMERMLLDSRVMDSDQSYCLSSISYQRIAPVRPNFDRLTSENYRLSEQQQIISTARVLALMNYFRGITFHQDGSRDYTVVGQPLNALEINVAMYGACPINKFGIERDDVINDEDELFSGQNSLLSFHRRLPGWMDFVEKDVRVLVAAIRENDLSVTPFIRWRRYRGGGRKWLMDRVDDDLTVRIKDQLRQRYGMRKTELTNSLLGLLLVAMFTESVSDSWPKLMDFEAEKADVRDENSQSMGSIQANGMVVMFAPQLLDTPDPRGFINVFERDMDRYYRAIVRGQMYAFNRQ